MGSDKTITKEDFALLLRWLDTDDGSAARKYEFIRKRLITIFTGRGCHEAELLADLTIDRVTLQITKLDGNYDGDPAVYFYGVARNIYFEWQRKQKPTREIADTDVAIANETVSKEAEFQCLESCLEQLGAGVREMILEYYRDDKQQKIERRKRLAEKLGISIGALQIKTSRVRARLLECVRNCLLAKA
jgi:DNA-directed RNA polymerase specialized sigma24 family protein